ncbi:MAG: SpoIIE family protein phosphatase [Lachnospirales bacterium]
MNNLCADIGYRSINHYGEELCGDNVEIIEDIENFTIVVLADGLGSGVKANILATLTSKIISTMIAQGLTIEDCVQTVVDTLPVCSVRGVAYSTFTIIKIINNSKAELIQFDNPQVIFLRNGENYEYDKTEMNIGGKTIYKSVIPLIEGDLFFAMSDGCPHAGIGRTYNFGWKREDIIEFVETFEPLGYTAKTLATMLIGEVNRLYGFKPGDDATACAIRIRERKSVNLMIGPPRNQDDVNKMMSLFFGKEGKHVICGGTTSALAASYLNKTIRPKLEYIDKDIPPIAEIDGVDLVTEGVITFNKVLTYANDYLGKNETYDIWANRQDGASLIARYLFEESTDIIFYVGRAINPAHQNPNLPINFSIKMNLVNELADCLKKMGKHIIVNYF